MFDDIPCVYLRVEVVVLLIFFINVTTIRDTHTQTDSVVWTELLKGRILPKVSLIAFKLKI